MGIPAFADVLQQIMIRQGMTLFERACFQLIYSRELPDNASCFGDARGLASAEHGPGF